MGNLLDEIPEAREFCRHVIANIDKYRLHEGEAFSQLHPAVLSTSQVDTQGDAFTPSALDQMADQVQREPLWMGFNHDPLVPPLGRMVAAKVFYAPASGLYFVAGVIGRYSESSYTPFSALGAGVVETQAAASEPRPAGPLVALACNPHEVPESDARAALEDAPDFVASEPALVFRKAADPLTVVTVLLSAWFFTNNAFSQKFLEQHGEAAAEVSLRLLQWLKQRVFALIGKLRTPRVLLELQAPYEGCCIDFIVDSKDPGVLAAALGQMEHAATAATALAAQVKTWNPQRIVYAWDRSAQKWIPQYVTTQRGVITDRPYLMAVEWSGLSVGGIAKQFERRGAEE